MVTLVAPEDRSPIQHTECFHLVFLRLLGDRLGRAVWAVKGGVNLRAWFRSRRYSEDLDIDVIRVQPHALEERVDRLLASRSLADLLSVQKLELARTAKPKQTDTTQRWKFEIRAESMALPLRTKIEFSRRASRGEEYVLEPVLPEMVRPYGVLAPMVNHYTARAAVGQKIQALGLRSVTQARDVWDLDHLFRTQDPDPRPLPAHVRKALPEAYERVTSLPYAVFKSQVVPFLMPEDQETYGTAEAWKGMCDLVATRLIELSE